MQGVTFKQVKVLNRYGYRIIDDDQEGILSGYEKGEVKEENKIFEVFPFDEMGRIKIHFVKDNIVILAQWIQLLPKQEREGIIFFYEKDDLLYAKEIIS